MVDQDQSVRVEQTAPAAPTGLGERIHSLDILRGFAVLGILIMNIQSFSMPDPTYFNPTIFGDLTGLNLGVWVFSHLFAELKFMTLFTMLFGAGIFLLCQRLEQRGLSPARIHYRRTLWLLLFGLCHAYLLWTGDILVWYAETALLAYLFWRVRPGWLVVWSVALLVIGTGLYAFFQWSLPLWPPEALENNQMWWSPGPEIVQHRLDTFRGGWIGQIVERIPGALVLQTFVFFIYGIWRLLALMLAGMALMKWGVLSAKRSPGLYSSLIAIGLLIGWPLTGIGAWQNFSHDWAYDYSMFGGTLYNYWGSILTALAYMSIIMLWCRREKRSRLKEWLGKVGRMAFSCYILQTIVCTTLFYGHGFGLYGMVPRWGQLLIVLAVWIVVTAFANLWLSRYRFGPLEWLWRALTYGKRPPMRLASAHRSS